MADTYRNWLQSRANAGDNNALALLQVVGDDGRVNDDFQRSGVNVGTKGGVYGKQQINDINSAYTGEYLHNVMPGGETQNSGSSGGGSYGVSASDPQAAAYYDDQINSANTALGRIGNQRDIGHSNIDNSFNQAYNQLLGQKATAERDYNTATQRAREDNTSARNAIYQGIGSTTAGLKRLLGSMGSGSSSAAQLLVPYAVGKQGTQQLGQTQQKFARNQQNLDTSWQDTTRNFDQNVNDLELQKQQKLQEFDAGLKQSEASLLDQLAGLTTARNQARGQTYTQARGASQGYQSRIQELLSAIDNLGRQYSNPIMRAGSINYNAPNLEQYANPDFNVGQMGTSQAPSDVISPYLTALFKDREQKVA